MNEKNFLHHVKTCSTCIEGMAVKSEGMLCVVGVGIINKKWQASEGAILPSKECRLMIINSLCLAGLGASDSFRNWLFIQPHGPNHDFDFRNEVLDKIEQIVGTEKDVLDGVARIIKLYADR